MVRIRDEVVQFERCRYLPNIVRQILGRFDLKEINWTNIRRSLLLFIAVLVVAHILACAFFAMSSLHFTDASCAATAADLNLTDRLGSWAGDSASWAIQDMLINVTCEYNETSNVTAVVVGNMEAQFVQYFRSLYWVINTMITTGFGDIIPTNMWETFFTTIVIYIGLLLTLAMIANITSFITDREESRSEHDKKLDAISSYIAARNVGNDLQQSVRHYYKYKWDALHGFEPEQEFQNFPYPIRAQVMGERSRRLLQKVDFLRQCKNRAFISAVIESLRLETVLPNDVVVKFGHKLSGALCLCQGECVKYERAMRRVVQSFDGKDTPVFGATSLLVPEKFDGVLKAKTFCEFISLPGSKFRALQMEFLNDGELQSMKESATKSGMRAKKMDKLFGLTDNGRHRKMNSICGACLATVEKWGESGSRFRHIMHVLLVLGGTWYAIVVPLLAAFAFSDCGGNFVNSTTSMEQNGTAMSGAYIVLLCVDNLWDVVYLLEVVLCWRFYHFLRNGVNVSSARLISERYCASKFRVVIDIFRIIPWQLLAIFVGAHWYFPLRIPKLLWSSNIAGYCESLLSAFSLKLNVIVTSTSRRFASLVVLVLFSSHIIGCGWVFVGYFSGCSSLTNESAEITTWIEAEMQQQYFIFDQTHAFVYLRAFYWALVAMTTVGYGDIRPHNIYETIYATFALLFGGLIYPAIVGAVAVLLTSLNAHSAEFRAKLDVIRKYMIRRQFPSRLRAQITSYFDYLWCTQLGVEEDSMLYDLPPSLRKQIACNIFKPAVKSMTIFAGCSNGFCDDIMSNMKSVVYLPGDLVIQIDEIAEHMYFLAQGIVKVSNRDQSLTLAILRSGDCFGETALLQDLPVSVAQGSSGQSRRTANVRACTYCNCITLSNSDFKRVLMDWTTDKDIIMKNIGSQFSSKRFQNRLVMDNFVRYRKLHSLASLDQNFNNTAGMPKVLINSFSHYDSNLQRLWRTVQFVGTLYNILIIPARIAFQALVPVQFFAVDAMFDIISVSDMIVKDRIVVYLDRGQIHSSLREVSEEVLVA